LPGQGGTTAWENGGANGIYPAAECRASIKHLRLCAHQDHHHKMHLGVAQVLPSTGRFLEPSDLTDTRGFALQEQGSRKPKALDLRQADSDSRAVIAQRPWDLRTVFNSCIKTHLWSFGSRETKETMIQLQSRCRAGPGRHSPALGLAELALRAPLQPRPSPSPRLCCSITRCHQTSFPGKFCWGRAGTHSRTGLAAVSLDSVISSEALQQRWGFRISLSPPCASCLGPSQVF